MGHIHELYDFIVSAFIVYDDKVLFVNHPRYDKWVPIGGHVELNEDPDQALLREIEEESGLTVELLGERPEFDVPGVKSLVTPHYMNAHEANPPHQHISLIYFLRANNDKAVKSDEHTEMKWLTVKEIDSPEYGLPASMQFYAKQAITCAAKTA